MSLIPMKYPIVGCTILGILFLFSMQQVCISPISDRPVIFYRYLSAVYCLNTWILSCLLVSHYETPNDSTMVTVIRLFTAWTIIWGTFALTNLSFRSVDAAYKSKVEKSSTGAPKWFSIMMVIVVFLHTIVIILCYIVTYILGNAIFIKCYYIFLDILIISSCIGVFIAIISVLIGLNEIIKLSQKLLLHTNNENNKIFENKNMSIKLLNTIRKQIKYEIELKNSQFIYEQIENDKKTKRNGDINKEYENISASEQVIKILTDSLSITAIEIEEINKRISSEQLDTINLQKLQRAKRSMNYTILFLILCFLVTFYDLIDYLISINFTIILSIDSSPYPTTFTYIGHFLFDFTVDLVLILSTYKRSNCCTTIAVNSFMYICCPLLDCKGKSEEYLNNVNKTIDINGNPLPMQIIMNNKNDNNKKYDNNNNNNNNEETQGLSNNDETRTEIPEAQFTATPKLHNKTSMTISTLLELPETNYKMQRIQSLNEDGIVMIIYDLENALLTVRKSLNRMNSNDDIDEEEEFDIVKRLTFDQASIAFGGKDGIDLLIVHFDSLIALDVKLFVISKKQCVTIKTILKTVGLLKYFVNNNDPIISDRVIGINHKLLQNVTNHQYSLNEKLLKIIEKCDCENDSVLYIDSDGNTINVEKINLCRTYGVKGTKGLQLSDFKAIQKKYFS